MSTDAQAKSDEKLVFGGGCFWCLEAVFEDLKGVKSVVSGYAGGNTPNPSYEAVCSGSTGHAEVVEITYDPAQLSLDTLMEVFFATHDPTTLNRQGNDVGTQYRSIVLYKDEKQKAAAEKAIREHAKEYRNPIVTQVEPLQKFYPAEGYHQGYFKSNPNKPYCSVVVAPKVKKFREKFKAQLKS